jgi:hypothetical protein
MPLLIPTPAELESLPWHVAEHVRRQAQRVIEANRRTRNAERVAWDDLYASDPQAWGEAVREMARRMEAADA